MIEFLRPEVHPSPPNIVFPSWCGMHSNTGHGLSACLPQKPISHQGRLLDPFIQPSGQLFVQ